MDNPYDDLLMEHIRNARNYRVLEHASASASGANALCGDAMTVYLKVEHERIADATFQCECCGVSMASASIMTEAVRGVSATKARMQVQWLLAWVGGDASAGHERPDPARGALVAVVRKYPARTRCAILPWLTLEAALDGRAETLYLR